MLVSIRAVNKIHPGGRARHSSVKNSQPGTSRNPTKLRVTEKPKIQRQEARLPVLCTVEFLPTDDPVRLMLPSFLPVRQLDIGFLRLPIGELSVLEVLTVHREPFVLVVPSSHKLAKRKRVRLGEVLGENFVMNERSYAPGFYDLTFGMLRDARIVPNVSQTAADLSTVISLVGAQMGVAILPASAVKHSVASVVACDIVGDLPMSEIGLVCDERVRAPIVDKFRSFALEKLARVRKSPHANRS